MVTDDIGNQLKLSQCNAIFAPLDEINRLEKVINNLEQIQKELLKVAEGLKPVTDE